MTPATTSYFGELDLPNPCKGPLDIHLVDDKDGHRLDIVYRAWGEVSILDLPELERAEREEDVKVSVMSNTVGTRYELELGRANIRFIASRVRLEFEGLPAVAMSPRPRPSSLAG